MITRTLLSGLFLMLGLNLLAQLNGHFSYTWSVTEEGENSTMTIDVYSSSKYFVIKGVDNDANIETAVLNRIGKTGIELFSDFITETERDNYYTEFGWSEIELEESDFVSDILTGILDMPNFNDGLQMLGEKSTILGVSCEKFKIVLPEEAGEIIGWIATGKHCLIEGNNYYLDTDKGMIMEMRMDFTDSNLSVKCTGFDTKFPENSTVYNMEIPSGYNPLEDEYSDEEGEEDEE